MNQPQPNAPRPNESGPSKRSRNRSRGGQNQRGGKQRNQRRSKPARPADIWADAPELPPVEPIVIPNGVDALVRSLGDGPSIGGSTVLDRYVVAVVERTAVIARALALSADVLADPEA